MTTDRSIHAIGDRFQSLFREVPRIYQAPGRVNLIGEHTDYNDGFVMPAAIGFYTWAAVSPRADRNLVMRSENLNEQVEISLDDLPPQGKHHWADYVVGVAKMLESSGRKIPGANLLIDGNVPQGAGLSSSASLEVAVASALLDLTGGEADAKELALLCQRAENEYVGARCGIMDQFIAAHGRRGKALMLDCRSLEYRLLPLPEEARLVICNTMVRHSVATGEYNQRRAECEQGVQILARHRPGVKALRDVSLADLEEFRNELPSKVFSRCRHVISENARVLDAASALERGDLEEIRTLMQESHRSLQHDFEVTCTELDAMVHVAGQVKGVYGARMTGGGFGGCTVNLVATECVEGFRAHVIEAYEQLTKIVPEIYVCSAADGAGRVA